MKFSFELLISKSVFHLFLIGLVSKGVVKMTFAVCNALFMTNGVIKYDANTLSAVSLWIALQFLEWIPLKEAEWKELFSIEFKDLEIALKEFTDALERSSTKIFEETFKGED